MSTDSLREANAIFRSTLNAVRTGQEHDPTPCASFDVTQLVDHTIGTHRLIVDALSGRPCNFDPIGVDASNWADTFDRWSEEALEALEAEGAMARMLDLPFGTYSGEELMGLGVMDTFQHAWDLAKATGQDTNLSPGMAAGLLAHGVEHMEHAKRGGEGAPYGPEQPVSEGAPVADRLAAFLGRVVEPAAV